MRRVVLLSPLLLPPACADDGASVGSGSDTSSSGAVDTSEGPTPVPVCTPGERECDGDGVRVCNGAGDGWTPEACDAGATCDDGVCVTSSDLHVVTEILAPAQVGMEYAAQFEAAGGAPPYTWAMAEPPAGLALTTEGSLEGTPEQAGDYVLLVGVEDAIGERVIRKFSLAIHSEPLTILTPPDLGAVDEGLPFERPLVAQGGITPYGWFLVGGAAPAGTFLNGAGVLTGVPTEPGMFDFTVRVVDVANPPGFDELAFQLEVQLRPLEIIGENILDLLAFKIVTLPLIAIIPGIPVPYDAQLEADGGLEPYTWTEQPVPDELQFLVTEAGIPDGLTLNPDGSISGAVDNTDQVITLAIPLSPISLTGFFFYAEVADAQNPAETDQALFLIPTVPVGG